MLTYFSSSIWALPTPAHSRQTLVNAVNIVGYLHTSKPEYIEAGLKKFIGCYEQMGITSISFPQLGTHHGGLRKRRHSF